MNLPLALKWAARSVSSRGLIRTSKVAGNVVLDLSFDFLHGTDTMRWVWTEDLGANSEHDQNAVGYRASKAGPLRKLIRKLDVKTGVLPRVLSRDFTFVDLGSGKGRVLLLAAQLGFQKVVGVEFSPKLCVIARNNVTIFTRQSVNVLRPGHKGITSQIEVVESDVARFNLPTEPCVFYAFNPFDQVVMERFIGNLRDSLEQFPRRIWLLYNTPIHSSVIDKSALFLKVEDFEIGGTEFKVYRNFYFP